MKSGLSVEFARRCSREMDRRQSRRGRYCPWSSRSCTRPPRQRQSAHDIIDVGLDAVHVRLPAVLHHGQAVRTEIAELHSLPLLMIDRSVPAQSAAEQGRFPTQLVVGQEVRRIWRRFRLAIDAAWPEALRPGRVEHQILFRLPLGVQAMDVSRTLAPTGHCLPVRANVGHIVTGNVQPAVAGRKRAAGVTERLQPIHGQAAILPRMRENRVWFCTEAREAIKRVVELVEAQAAGERHLVRYVPVRFAEYRIVLVLTRLRWSAREFPDSQTPTGPWRDCRSDNPGRCDSSGPGRTRRRSP